MNRSVNLMVHALAYVTALQCVTGIPHAVHPYGVVSLDFRDKSDIAPFQKYLKASRISSKEEKADSYIFSLLHDILPSAVSIAAKVKELPKLSNKDISITYPAVDIHFAKATDAHDAWVRLKWFHKLSEDSNLYQKLKEVNHDKV